ncbi:MAG TPA: TrbI/VirB10 family protein, partial [Burkholderiaceae bacterium]
DPDAAAKAQRLHLAMQARSSVSFQMTRAAEAPHDVAAARHQAMAAQADDPTSTYKAGLAQTRGGLSGASPGSATGGAARAGGIDSVGLSQFAGSAEVDRWRLDHRAEPPASPYELRAGSVIPATLISGINSELPGMILGQVAADVYDTATGRRLLIPQGARLVGEYSSNVAYGQSRVLVAWQRIVFPDGKALDLGAMPGADSAGYSGFNDLVDNHYLRIFGSAILMSAVTAGVTLSQPAQTTNTNGTVSAGTAMSEALGQQLGQTAAQMINKNMNIAPTLEIRPGYRFNVMATKDLVLAGPYRAFDY